MAKDESNVPIALGAFRDNEVGIHFVSPSYINDPSRLTGRIVPKSTECYRDVNLIL